MAGTTPTDSIAVALPSPPPSAARAAVLGGLLLGTRRNGRHERQPQPWSALCAKTSTPRHWPPGRLRTAPWRDSLAAPSMRCTFCRPAITASMRAASASPSGCFQPGLGGDRQQRGLGQGLEGHWALMRAPAASVTAASSEAWAKAGLTMPPAGRAGRRPRAEQLENQPLALGNQVDAIQQRIAEPGNSSSRVRPGVAEARAGPFRGVGRDAIEQVFEQVVEAAVVQTRGRMGMSGLRRRPAWRGRQRWANGMSLGVVSFQPSSSRTVTASAPGVPERASR